MKKFNAVSSQFPPEDTAGAGSSPAPRHNRWNPLFRHLPSDRLAAFIDDLLGEREAPWGRGSLQQLEDPERGIKGHSLYVELRRREQEYPDSFRDSILPLLLEGHRALFRPSRYEFCPYDWKKLSPEAIAGIVSSLKFPLSKKWNYTSLREAVDHRGRRIGQSLCKFMRLDVFEDTVLPLLSLDFQQSYERRVYVEPPNPKNGVSFVRVLEQNMGLSWAERKQRWEAIHALVIESGNPHAFEYLKSDIFDAIQEYVKVPLDSVFAVIESCLHRYRPRSGFSLWGYIFASIRSHAIPKAHPAAFAHFTTYSSQKVSTEHLVPSARDQQILMERRAEIFHWFNRCVERGASFDDLMEELAKRVDQIEDGLENVPRHPVYSRPRKMSYGPYKRP